MICMTAMTLLTVFIISKIDFLDLDDNMRHSPSMTRTLARWRGRIVGTPERIVSVNSDSLGLSVFLLAYALISLNSRDDPPCKTTRWELLRSWIIDIYSCSKVFFIPHISDFLKLDIESRSFIPLLLNHISLFLFCSWVWRHRPFNKFNGLLFSALIKRRQMDVIISYVIRSS